MAVVSQQRTCVEPRPRATSPVVTEGSVHAQKSPLTQKDEELEDVQIHPGVIGKRVT